MPEVPRWFRLYPGRDFKARRLALRNEGRHPEVCLPWALACVVWVWDGMGWEDQHVGLAHLDPTATLQTGRHDAFLRTPLMEPFIITTRAPADSAIAQSALRLSMPCCRRKFLSASHAAQSSQAPCRSRRRASAFPSAKSRVVSCQACNVKHRESASENHERALCAQADIATS